MPKKKRETYLTQKNLSISGKKPRKGKREYLRDKTVHV